ncbi:Asp23/Gls24 family envelope stress response protein [Oscillospiraceae bacterium MB08-C2-2]|nr:Asp23/Gls24 family envelope stress response protein [Oscillospiraceae bacterium MB08-C2-2]
MQSVIKIENHLGKIEVSNNYFANLVGHAVSECYGVAGLDNSTPYQGLRSLLFKRDFPDKGVRVKNVAGALVINLYIVVTYGVNISVIVKSIINKVTYTVEAACGLTVSKVNVYITNMKSE